MTSINLNANICPFENHVFLTLTKLQKLKIAIASVTIVPIRLVTVIFILLIVWIIGPIPTAFRSEEDKKRPLDGWRLWFKPVITFFSRLIFFIGGFHWVSVYGKQDKNVRLLACAPHSSFFDVLAIVYLNYPTAIGRAGAEDVPLFGYLTKLTQPLIVDRDSKQSRLDVIRKIQERLTSPLEWPKLFIFAEGTCTNRKALLEYKIGPFLPGLPLQPVCIKYKDKFDTISWPYKGPSVWWLLWLTLCNIHNSFEIHYLPVYYPNEEEVSNPELYASNVRLVMAKYLNLPISDYSFEDIRLMSKFERYRLPYKLGKIKVNKIKKQLGVSLEGIFDLVPLYTKCVDLSTGLGSIETLRNYFGINFCDELAHIYELFDKVIFCLSHK